MAVPTDPGVLFKIPCRACGSPLTADDLTAQGLRLPEPDETSEEYVDAELCDDVRHPRCLNPS